MTTSIMQRSSTRSGKRRTRATPCLEGLESRQLLYATLGGSFVFGSRITYSFVPDGTSIGGVPSNMYATLNGIASTAVWQSAFKRAAAMWSSYANINMVEVPDNGAPLGVAGNQQGDTRFGDIRISMIPQSPGVLGSALLPPPFNGGTAAGDVILNSSTAWAINGNYDVQTVAMHEIGHSLGLDHSTIASAVMFTGYNNIKQSLTTDDVNGIRSIYGAYPADAINDGNFANATNITPLISPSGQISLGGQSLAGPGDLDFFKVVVPANTTGTMTVSMQSTNLSSVSPRMSLFNNAQIGVATVTAPNSMGTTITATVPGVAPGQTFYIRASAASSYGSYGAYGILVNFGSGAQAPIAPPNTTVPAQPDAGGGSINQEVVEIGGFTGFGEQLHEVPVGTNAQSRVDPAGWSIFLASMDFLDDELVDKALRTLRDVNPTNWETLFDAVIANWGDSGAVWRILKDVKKNERPSKQ